LTPADKAVVLKAAHDSATYEKQLIRDNEKEMVKFLQSKGMIVNENPDKKAWQDAMLPVYSQFSDTYGKELIDSIRNFKY
jgi:TRAP-type C4-dicarboxylate transport system substrate-binding protein